MRYGPDDKFWVVVDPTPHSTLEYLVFEASLRDLELQFKGGLQIDENSDTRIDHVEVYGADGTLVFAADIPQEVD